MAKYQSCIKSENTWWDNLDNNNPTRKKKKPIRSIRDHFELFDGDMMLSEDEKVLSREDFQGTGPDHVFGPSTFKR